MAAGKTVCVTGAGGFIASWVVKELLDRGYTVKATVRNPEKSKHLLALDGASERLQLVTADILTPGVFDSILEGCDGVFHTAAALPGSDSVMTEAEIEEVAVKGTVNVLESCAKARPKRIVLTSSASAIWYCAPDATPCLSDLDIWYCTPDLTADTVLDETCFSTVDIINKSSKATPAGKAYARGKTLSEEAAWDLVKKHGLDMVVINPVFVAGAVLQPSVNATNEFAVALLSGKMKVIPDDVMTWVGVKDVAKAHVLGYENPKAEGRYLLAERVLHNYEFADILKKLFPQYKVEARKENDAAQVPVYSVSTTKTTEQLGIKFEPIENVLRESIECFRDLKFLDQ